MAKMNVTVSKMSVGFGTEKKEMYVSKVQRATIYELDDIAHQVALESGVNERQFRAAVGCMVDAMIVFLKGGNGVSLQDFGTFLPEVKSVSSEDPAEVGVRRVRVSFRPHKKLWDAVSGISYELTNDYAQPADTAEGGTDTSTDSSGTTTDGGSGGSGSGEDFE